MGLAWAIAFVVLLAVLIPLSPLISVAFLLGARPGADGEIFFIGYGMIGFAAYYTAHWMCGIGEVVAMIVYPFEILHNAFVVTVSSIAPAHVWVSSVLAVVGVSLMALALWWSE